jgi:uncharacterized protein YukE
MAKLKIDEEQLMKMKKNVDEAKNNIAQYNGQLQILMKQLKTEWELSTVEEIDSQIEVFDTNIRRIDIKIEKGTAELEQTIDTEGNE